MDTASAPAHAQPEAIDPTHDIDGLKVSGILVVTSILFIITMWLLFQLFAFVIADEREKKIGEAESPALQQLTEQEEAELSGAGGGKSIDQAIQEIVK